MAHAAHGHAPAAGHEPPKIAPPGGHSNAFLSTYRTDNWWVGPALTLLVLGGFGVYLFLVAWQASYYVAGPYLSPLYSPTLFVKGGVIGGLPESHSVFGAWPAWWPSWIPASPAFLVVWMPTMFRGTCYYYRKAYYRAFFGWPPACAVAPMQYGRYEGETNLLVFQNLHRYTLYIALLLLPILFFEAFNSLRYDGRFGIGLGSVLLLASATTLTGYTLGCHSFRHLVGGKLDCFSCDSQSQTRGAIWKRVSWLNARHMQFAWVSLLLFWATDIYIRAVSMGLIPDLNTWEGLTWSFAATVAGGSH